MENQSKKDPSSVASFIHHCLLEKFKTFTQVKEIVFFSDGTGGQNKNKFMVAFASYLARVFGVTIRHIFPIVGHSFSQCDRNFGLVKSCLKKKQTITRGEPYLEAMSSCRTPPFEVLFDASIIKQWSTLVNRYFSRTPKCKGTVFGIQKYVMLKFTPDGMLHASQTYSPEWIHF